MEKVASTRLALDRYYVDKQTVGYDIRLIWYIVLCFRGTAVHRPQVKILKEVVEAVDGDKHVIEEVNV